MSEAVLVDALPYFDAGFDEKGVRETALAMVNVQTFLNLRFVHKNASNFRLKKNAGDTNRLRTISTTCRHSTRQLSRPT